MEFVTEKINISELIVVEGKDDVSALRRIVNADIMTTCGLGFGKEEIERIKKAAQKQGIIIFTDPDFPGGKIRRILDQNIPCCKHAYLSKDAARDPKTGKLGVEYAKDADLIKALRGAKATMQERTITYTLTDLVLWGLAGANSSKRRQALCDYLEIGHANNKSLLQKLNAYQIPKEEIELFLTAYLADKEEENES